MTKKQVCSCSLTLQHLFPHQSLFFFLSHEVNKSKGACPITEKQEKPSFLKTFPMLENSEGSF